MRTSTAPASFMVESESSAVLLYTHQAINKTAAGVMLATLHRTSYEMQRSLELEMARHCKQYQDEYEHDDDCPERIHSGLAPFNERLKRL